MLQAKQITPTNYGWTVLVQVLERSNPRNSNTGGEFRGYTITDMQGTKVPMVAFGTDVYNFEHTLLPYNRYKVSNAIVKFTLPAYRVFEYPCTWTVHKRILIEPYPDIIPHSLPCPLHLTKFSDFHLYADQPRDVCIKAMVVCAFPVHDRISETSHRDYIVVNEEMIPVLLRVWDDLLHDSDVNTYAKYKKPTMVVAYGIRVTTHNWLSLETKKYVYFMQDPPLNETCPLKDWYVAHSDEVQKMVKKNAWRDTSLLFHPPRQGEIISLEHALSTIENAKTVWTEGRLSLVPGQKKLWIQVCVKCYTEVHPDAEWNIWCTTCEELTDMDIHGDIIVYLSNGAKRIQATIKSPDLEKLLPFTPIVIMRSAMQGKPLNNAIEAALKGKHVICFLKYSDPNNHGLLICRFPILKVYAEADIHAYYDSTTQPTQSQASYSLNSQSSKTEGPTSSNTAMVYTEKQFFSPNTKNVLEDIIQGPSLDDIQSDYSSGVKRMLTFETTPEKALDNKPSNIDSDWSSTSTPEAEAISLSNTSDNFTPTKKS